MYIKLAIPFFVFFSVVSGQTGCLVDSFDNAINLETLNSLSPRATNQGDADWVNAQFRWGTPSELSDAQRTYLQHVDQSINDSFLPAFEKGEFADDWINTTREQQRIVVKGHGDGSEYKGNHNMAASSESADDIAGVYRNERGYESGTISVGLTSNDARLSNEALAHMPDDVPINGLPKEAWPKNMMGMFHRYPDLKYIPLYQARAKELAKELTEAVKKKDNVDHILETLSDYYHVTSNAHMFPKVNNSVFMTQVNAILSKIGLKPMPHENWDYIAATKSTDDFRAVFIEKIKAINGLQ